MSVQDFSPVLNDMFVKVGQPTEGSILIFSQFATLGG